MEIFDCTTYYSEDLILDLRFNILNEHVSKFIVVESLFSHSGAKKKLNFDINNFKKFKDKIIYLVIEKEPIGIKDLKAVNTLASDKRFNSLLRIEQSYDFMQKGITDANDNDLIILSDNDEIPDLLSKDFQNLKNDICIFKQSFFYYKLNLLYNKMHWFGSKAVKKKYIRKKQSMSWIRNLKNKKYPLWRLDTLFSDIKYSNLKIINNGGWHFTNLKSAENLYEKMKNFGHHDEFDDSGITVDDIKLKIQNREVFYDHFLDKADANKWKASYKLEKINFDLLPRYIRENKEKYKDWIV
jgi:beta-1,4-mannosyl-glycoprotein beta-1,4-N-acetylglucosaminyltransferase